MGLRKGIFGHNHGAIAKRSQGILYEESVLPIAPLYWQVEAIQASSEALLNCLH